MLMGAGSEDQLFLALLQEEGMRGQEERKGEGRKEEERGGEERRGEERGGEGRRGEERGGEGRRGQDSGGEWRRGEGRVREGAYFHISCTFKTIYC